MAFSIGINFFGLLSKDNNKHNWSTKKLPYKPLPMCLIGAGKKDLKDKIQHKKSKGTKGIQFLNLMSFINTKYLDSIKPVTKNIYI